MTVPVHGTITDGSQSIMYSVLSSSSYVTDITKNIYDGDAHKVASRVGYPFIVIAPPVYSKTPMTQVAWEATVTIPLIYRTEQEAVLRQLSDAIEQAIIEAESTFILDNMVNPSFSRPAPDNDVGANGKIIYGFARDVYFDVQSVYYPPAP